MSAFNRDKQFIPGLTCPACEEDRMRPTEVTNAFSRYAVRYICSRCGTREALEGFFWRDNCLKRGIELSEAGRHEVYGQTPNK